jgi:hypothetical protein
MFDVSKWTLVCIAAVSLTKPSLAEEVVLVVDPKGNAVQSDIVRSAPAPRAPLGRTNAAGRLSLAQKCAAGAVLLAEPPIDFVAHGSTCTGLRGDVKIEVTQRFVIATLESNLQIAQRAGNQAAVAQIAGELSERTKFADPAKGLHYKNVAAVALADTFAPALHEPTTGALGQHLVWDPAQPQHWKQICEGEQTLIKCHENQPQGLELNFTNKFQDALKQDPDAPPPGTHDATTNEWLKKYSGQHKEALLYQTLDPKTLRTWTAPASPQG